MTVNRINIKQIKGLFLNSGQNFSDITIPTGQNFVVLNVGSGQAPNEVASVGNFSQESIEGAVVANLAGSVGSFNLTAIVPGSNVLTPKNIIIIREATTKLPIFSSNSEVYGLLQVNSTVVSGDNFDDISKRIQISFVRQNSEGTALEAVPIAAIENKTINYQYLRRISLLNIDEDSLLEPVFQEPGANGGSTTVDSSIARLFMLMGS